MSLTDKLEQWASVYEEHKGEPLRRTPISRRELGRAESFWSQDFTSEMVELYTFSNGFFGNQQKSFLPSSFWFPSAAYATKHVGDLDFQEQVELDVDFFSSNSGATDRSVPIMFGSYVLGVVCSGPGTGAVWSFDDEGLLWVARSLEEIVSHAISWQERGWVDWTSHPGVRRAQGCPGGAIPSEVLDPPWASHAGDWRWEDLG